MKIEKNEKYIILKTKGMYRQWCCTLKYKSFFHEVKRLYDIIRNYMI